MANWKNHIRIKELFTNEPNDQDVLAICNALIPQLKMIYKRDIKTLEDNNLDFEFEDIIDNFEFIKRGIEDNTDPMEFDFNSWTDAFNEYLQILYDIADTTIAAKDYFNQTKFLWVG